MSVTWHCMLTFLRCILSSLDPGQVLEMQCISDPAEECVQRSLLERSSTSETHRETTADVTGIDCAD